MMMPIMLRPGMSRTKTIHFSSDSSQLEAIAQSARQIMTRALCTQKKTTKELVMLDAEIQMLQKRKVELFETSADMDTNNKKKKHTGLKQKRGKLS